MLFVQVNSLNSSSKLVHPATYLPPTRNSPCTGTFALPYFPLSAFALRPTRTQIITDISVESGSSL